MRVFAICLLLPGCGGTVAMGSNCEEILVAEGLEADEATAMGFSARDIETLVADGVRPGRSTADADGAEVARQFTMHLDSLQDIRTEKRTPPRRDMDGSCTVLQTETLVMRATFEMASDDGWVAASGDATIYAQGPDLSQVWVITTLPAEGSADLVAAAEARAMSELNCPN